MDLGLSGRVVIVTGGASNLGRAITLGFAGLWIYVATHAPALGAAVPPEALRQSIPGFTGGLLAYVVATLIGAFYWPVAAVIIFGLLAVYYLFEHLPSPEEGADSGPDGQS